MASVTLRRLSKSFDRSSPPALQDLTLEVRDGEFLVLLGPSGCGKTTALRCIAGLDDPTARENIAFALEMRRVPKAQIDRKVLTAADRLDLRALLDRHPAQLSGGQRQ